MRLALERALDEIYAEIPSIPDCDGTCACACGPIAMQKAEWERLRRVHGRTPTLKAGLTCSVLSANGRCTAYGARPLICRIYATTPKLQCPKGCVPERWLTDDEVRSLMKRVRAAAGETVCGTMSKVPWEGISREGRPNLIEQAKESLRGL